MDGDTSLRERKEKELFLYMDKYNGWRNKKSVIRILRFKGRFPMLASLADFFEPRNPLDDLDLSPEQKDLIKKSTRHKEWVDGNKDVLDYPDDTFLVTHQGYRILKSQYEHLKELYISESISREIERN